jgi:hypothetical protein
MDLEPVSTVVAEQTKMVALPSPPAVKPFGFVELLNRLLDFIRNVFEIPVGFTITGPRVVTEGNVVSYTIDIELPTEPDHNFSDGTYVTRFGYWALIDKNGNVVEASDGVEVGKRFTADVTVTISRTGNYVIVGVVTEVRSYYDFDKGAWVNGEEDVVAKEGFNVVAEKRTVEGPPQVEAKGIGWIVSALRYFLLRLFGLVGDTTLFGW